MTDRKVQKAIIWAGAETWGRHLLSFAVLTYLARVLSPADFGLAALAAVFIGVLQILSDQGLSETLIQRRQLRSADVSTAFWLNMAVALALAASLFLSAATLARAFSEPRLALVLIALTPTLIINAAGMTTAALLRRELHFGVVAKASLGGSVAGAIAAAVIATMGGGVWALVGQSLFGAAVSTSMLLVRGARRIELTFSLESARQLLSFGSSVTATKIVNAIGQRADSLLIGYFLGANALGYYAIGYRLFEVMCELFLDAASRVSLPEFARLQANPIALGNSFRGFSASVLFIAVPAFFGVGILAPPLMEFLLGPGWGLSASVLQILCLLGLPLGLFFFNNSLLLATGRPHWQLAVVMIQTVGNVALFALALPFGIVAVAGAYVARAYLTSPLHLWIIRRVAGLRVGEIFRAGRGPVVAAIAMALLIWAVDATIARHATPVLRLAAGVGVGAPSYLGAVWLIDRALTTQTLIRIRGVLQFRQ